MPNGEEPTATELVDFQELASDAEVVEITAGEQSEIAGTTLQKADADGLFFDDIVVIAIKRDEGVITPRGDIEFRDRDVVTLFSRNGLDDAMLDVFTSSG